VNKIVEVHMAACFGRIVVAGSLASFVLAVSLAAQAPSAQTVPKVKRVAAPPLQSLEGADNYTAYCAVCHGPNGKGDGPAAPAMKVPVPDLTTFAKRHEGKFNRTDVEDLVRGASKTRTPAHGVEDMPIWGEVFRSDDKARTTLRIGNLVKYLESIQVK
jgi:mono/diheme cytochrome c family protein